MANLNKLITKLFFVALLLFSFNMAQAASPTASNCPPGSTKYTEGILKGLPCDQPVETAEMTVQAIKNIIQLIFLPAAGMIFSIMFILGSIFYITSNGNPQRAEKGKKTLTWAIAGLLVVVLSEVLIGLFTNVIGGNLK